MCIVTPIDVHVDEHADHQWVMSSAIGSVGAIVQCMVCGRWARTRTQLDTVSCVPLSEDTDGMLSIDELEVR